MFNFPNAPSFPVARPASCFRGRVLVLDDQCWSTLSVKDLEGSLQDWNGQDRTEELRKAVISHCRQSFVDEQELAQLISLDLVDAIAAKHWSIDYRYIEEQWSDRKIEQGGIRDVSEDGCWLREGLWVGILDDRTSFSVYYVHGNIADIAFNDGRILGGEYHLQEHRVPSRQTGSGLATCCRVPLNWARKLTPEGATMISRRLSGAEPIGNSTSPKIVNWPDGEYWG